jgi:hypothetical protein
VQGRTSPLLSNNCVIPTFLPKIPFTGMFFSELRSAPARLAAGNQIDSGALSQHVN